MYAVLGATGKVGREVVSVLRAAGQPVRAIVRDITDVDPAPLHGCEIVQADIRDADALARALAGASAVHAIVPTAKPGEDGPATMLAAIRAIAAAIDAARPQRVLAVSDYGAQHAEGTGMAAVFHELERALGGTSAALVLLRSAEHMQNWSRSARTALASGTLPSMHHPVTQPFPTVSASDVGRIAGAILLEHWASLRRVVHVEGPRRYSASDVAAVFSSAFGRDIVAFELPRETWAGSLERAGVPPGTARALSAFYDACNAGLIDVDPPEAEVRHGPTELADALRGIVRA
jgi:NAD(P)H dehydrogenase (quinone)